MNLNKLLPLFLFLPIGACSSVGYGDPDAVETINIDYGSTDLQSFAAKMVESMNTAPSLNYFEHPGKTQDKRVIVYFGGIDNATSEHIDTGSIRDSIQTALLKGGKFRFVAGKPGQQEIGDQVAFQQGSGRVDPTQAKAFGKQLGADVVVYGTLRSIEKQKGRSLETGGMKTDDVYYKFTLQCDSIETAEVLWMEEKELRKTAKTGLFGS
jgi:penicillin-binding protein activator